MRSALAALSRLRLLLSLPSSFRALLAAGKAGFSRGRGTRVLRSPPAIAVVLAASACAPALAQTGWIIETVAGTADVGDGAAATAAQLRSPFGVAVDGSGNVYIADRDNDRIRKVDTSTGNISTVAGTGTPGFSGDGAAAASAQLNGPYGAAVDGSGNLYIADTFNNRIRKVDASTGNISTVAGTGAADYSGDGAAAAEAQLNSPRGVAVDGSGNLYIADWLNRRIRKVTASTGNISTVAGTGIQGYSGGGDGATQRSLWRGGGRIRQSVHRR